MQKQGRKSKRPLRPHRAGRPRRGSIYIAVLGAAMLVTLLGLTALAAVRVQRLTAGTAADAEQARLYAQSAVELGALWVQSDPLWRITRPNGVWTADQPIGDGTFTLEGFDPIDGDLVNRPTDPLILRATATRGRATQIVQARMDASGPPLNVLETALYTSGGMRVRGDTEVAVDGGAAGVALTLRNDGTIDGDVECLLYTGNGDVTGTITEGTLPRELPASDVFAMYAALGTPISPGDTIDRRLLAPGVNPWGATDPDGVYVINTTQDLEITRSRIYGTLVVIAPGRTVTISSRVLMHNAREDYPVLLVDGDVLLRFTSESDLSEPDLGINFNPPAAPYEGESNLTTTDIFPSEIRGLVHVRGTLRVQGVCRVRGTVIIESEESDAIDVRDNLQVYHNPDLLTTPPMGYMKSVNMNVAPGSWRQVVLP